MKSVLRAFSLLLLAAAAASCHGGKPSETPNDQAFAQLSAKARVGFAVAEPPMALTASDGTTLRLATLRADAVIDGPLAFTEVHLAFENPLDRTLEGNFRITLPAAASLGRFAMKIGEEWQEGEVVEIAAARRAYEDFLHRKQDPALLEKSAGNEFSARVFPIPARGTKEIVVSWVEELEGPYVFALRGLPQLDSLDVRATSATTRDGKAKLPHLTQEQTAPANDYVVDAALIASRDAAGNPVSIRSGDLALVRVRPQATSKPDPIGDAIVLVDTSASRVLGFDAEIELAGKIARKIAETTPNAKLTLAAFDQKVEQVFVGRAADFGASDALTKLRRRDALGASDLEHALAWAAATAKTNQARRVILVTDGVATAGATESPKLKERVAALRGAGVERLDAVAIGGIHDDAVLLRLVRGNLARDGVVTKSTADSAEVVRRLSEATASGIVVKVDGAGWTWPSKLDGVQAGDTYSVYAELPEKKALSVTLDGRSQVIEPRRTDRPLLERAIAQAKISSMLEREALAAKDTSLDDLRKGIVSLATRQRIMTPYTAMLVLETGADYDRYGIDRRSLADVLAVDDGMVHRLHRTAVKLPLAAPAVEADDDTSFAANSIDDAKGFMHEDAEARKAPRRSAAPSASAAPPGNMPAPRVAATSASPSPKPASAAPAPAPPQVAKALEEASSSGRGMATGAAVPRPRVAARPAPAARAPRETTSAHDEERPRSVRPGPVRSPEPLTDSMMSATSQAQLADAGELDSDVDPSGPRDTGSPPYTGPYATVMDKIRTGHAADALTTAQAWRAEAPGDVLALTAIGEAAEASGNTDLAERAYGSVLDLFPNRADLRRFAGERLERLASKDPAALDLAIDTYEKARADRPDHPASHRLLTFALVKKKLFARAFETAVAGAERSYVPGQFAGVDQILHEDVGLVGAVWAKAEPKRKDEIMAKIRAARGIVEDQPSLRFVLNWETDANDVDFHIHDGRGGHAFFSHPQLRSGGRLYADVTTGYGPECFTIRGKKLTGPYHLEAHYYSRGPMGYGMGKLEIIEHDGQGGITFEERPFIVMVDQAYVDLGSVH